jgi:PAS domain S-box-containing protein
MRVPPIVGQKAASYLVAVVTAVVAVYLRYLLIPLIGEANPYHTAWIAVVFCALYCGLWPSILCVVVSGLGVNYFFIPPPHSLLISSSSQLYGMVAFLVFSAAIIALGESSRRASYSRARLAAIVDSSDDAIISKNLDGVITTWNYAAERLFGWTASEAVGKSITIIIPPELYDQEVEILRRLRNGERIEHLETVRRKKSGEQVEVAITISPVMSPLGTVVGASKVARDITERKQVEARLKAAHDHLEERVEKRTAELWERNKELLKQAETVRQLSGRLLQSQDDERRRIARELHDSVGQLLAAVGMTVSKLSKAKQELSPEINKSVEEISELTQQALAEIRTVTHLLHPPLLDEVGLASAIKGFIEGFARRSKIQVSFDTSAGFERLSSDYELTIFRIVQECLTNIHRHSGSKIAKIYLSRIDGFVHCEISDEGKGMPQDQQLAFGSSAANMGLGFRGMKERVRQFGGDLQIRSNGKGTTVAVALPVTRKAQEFPVRLRTS